CSRFSRCCHLIADLPTHPRWKFGQAINAVTGTRRLGFVLPIGSTTRLPVAWPDCYCAAVHKPPHLPTGDAATPLTFERWPRWLVSFRFSLPARPTSGPSVAGRFPPPFDVRLDVSFPELGAVSVRCTCEFVR